MYVRVYMYTCMCVYIYIYIIIHFIFTIHISHSQNTIVLKSYKSVTASKKQVILYKRYFEEELATKHRLQ